MNQPAKILGEWITAKRKEAGIRVSDAAGILGLGPVKYTEMECGIGKWLSADHVGTLVGLLGLNKKDQANLSTLQRKTADEPATTKFSEVFTRAQLSPVRYRTYKRSHTVSAKEEDRILDHVFTETVA